MINWNLQIFESEKFQNVLISARSRFERNEFPEKLNNYTLTKSFVIWKLRSENDWKWTLQNFYTLE